MQMILYDIVMWMLIIILGFAILTGIFVFFMTGWLFGRELIDAIKEQVEWNKRQKQRRSQTKKDFK